MTKEIEPGDMMIVRLDGVIVSICQVRSVTKTQFALCGWSGLKWMHTGKQVGGKRIATRGSPTEIASAESELKERLEQEERDEDAKRQAEYDALPETVKLARSLRWLCDCESEAQLAQAPIEAMRTLVAWAKERNMTTE